MLIAPEYRWRLEAVRSGRSSAPSLPGAVSAPRQRFPIQRSVGVWSSPIGCGSFLFLLPAAPRLPHCLQRCCAQRQHHHTGLHFLAPVRHPRRRLASLGIPPSLRTPFPPPPHYAAYRRCETLECCNQGESIYIRGFPLVGTARRRRTHAGRWGLGGGEGVGRRCGFCNCSSLDVAAAIDAGSNLSRCCPGCFRNFLHRLVCVKTHRDLVKHCVRQFYRRCVFILRHLHFLVLANANLLSDFKLPNI